MVPFYRHRHHTVSTVSVLLALVCLGCTSGSASSVPASSTGPTTAEPPAPSERDDVSVPDTPGSGTSAVSVEVNNGCDVVPPVTWLSTGTMHTVVMSTEPMSVSISTEPGSVCPGGAISATVTFRNDGTESVTVAEPLLILSGGMDKWQLGTLDFVTVEAGEEHSAVLTVTVPLVAPGRYGLFVHGFAPGEALFIEPPDE